IRVLRTLVATDARSGQAELGVAYEVVRSGERFWNDAYWRAAEAASPRRELAPIWRHTCAQCAYLGQYLWAGKEYDLYSGHDCAPGAPTPLARWSDAPEDVVGDAMAGELLTEATRRIAHLHRSRGRAPERQ